MMRLGVRYILVQGTRPLKPFRFANTKASSQPYAAMQDEAYDVHKLESGWNNRVSNGNLLGGGGSKFLKSASGEFLASIINKRKPLKHVRSHTLHNKPQRSDDGADFTAFDSISAAFGFVHHPGTDKTAELKVLRQVLVREGILLKLREACRSKSSKKKYLQSKNSTGVLDYLTQLRDVTVELTEMVSAWRATSISGHDIDVPRPFMWEDKNYLIKLSRDLDFIADISSLVEALGVTADTMRRNPLMMPESLSVEKLDRPPYEWAMHDAGGDSESVLYAERLRLREAEHVILRELAAHSRGAPSVSWASAADAGSLESDSLASKSHRHDPSRNISREHLESLTSWQRDAELQLRVLENSTGERLNIDAITTHRLNPPELEPIIAPPKYFHSPPRLIPASPLTDLSSSIQLARSRSPSPTTTNTFRGLKLRSVRGLPHNETAALTARGLVLMSQADIQVIAAIEQAPKSLAIAGAATMIIMAEGFEIPGNVSWDAFRGRAVQSVDFAEDMNNIDPSKLPQYKVRAMKPFMRKLEEEFVSDSAADPLLQSSPATSAPAKLIKWVNQVLSKTKDEPKYARRAEVATAGANTKRSDAHAVKRSQSTPTPKPATALKNVRTLHSEIVDGLLQGASLTISLLADKKPRGNDNNNMRYFVRVYDPSSSREADCCIQLKNYIDLAEDLRVSCGGADISAAFDPSSEKWWIKNIQLILVVEERSSKSLKVFISREKIEAKVMSYHSDTKKVLRPKSSSANRPASPSSAAVSTKDHNGGNGWGFQTEPSDDSPAEMEVIFQQQQHHDRPISAAGDTQPTGELVVSDATAAMFAASLNNEESETAADTPTPSADNNAATDNAKEIERQKSATLLNLALGAAEEENSYDGDFDEEPAASPPPAPHTTPAEQDNDSYAADDFESAEGVKEEGGYEDDYEEDFS